MKKQKQTSQIEMVETHNLYLSLERLRKVGTYDRDKWRRALYHALSMSDCVCRLDLEKIRQALDLP